MLSELTLGELFDYALEALLILMEIKQSMVIQLQKKVRSSDPFVLRILLFSLFYMFYGKVEIPYQGLACFMKPDFGVFSWPLMHILSLPAICAFMSLTFFRAS